MRDRAFHLGTSRTALRLPALHIVWVGETCFTVLIDSEVNNFLVNIAPAQKLSPIARQWLRLKVAIHERMLRVLDRMWQSTFRFERVYIDNLLLAHKRR
jgi:hypothetical protein